MENYIVINGKKAELTEEQLKALEIEVPKKNVFSRVEINEIYYYIGYDGTVRDFTEWGIPVNLMAYKTANYCTNKSIMEQRALHEILSRLLWRYSMMHDGDKISANDCYTIYYNFDNKEYGAGWSYGVAFLGEPKFYSMDIARNAIEEVIKPFIAEHPEFVW